MTISLQHMLNGHVQRLRYVFRYSTARVSHPESVAEHSYYVVLYSMFIARWLLSKYIDVDMGYLLQRAVLHDLEESRSGDFPRPFKYSSEELKAMLAEASQQAFRQVIGEVVGGDDEVKRLQILWKNAKDDTREGRILSFADYLAVLSFMMEEGAASGNRAIREHVECMDKYALLFELPAYDFIRELVEDAKKLARDLFQ